MGRRFDATGRRDPVQQRRRTLERAWHEIIET
jgi:hypothetical protein